MSKEGDDDEEARFFLSFKKYEKIVKQMRQFDEIAEIMDVVSSKSSKKKKNSGGQGCCSTAVNGTVAVNQENLNQVLVETITKFLNELNEDEDSKPSNSNP